MDLNRADVNIPVSALQFIQSIHFLLLFIFLNLYLLTLFILLILLSYSFDRFIIVRHVLTINNKKFAASNSRLTLVSQ